MRTAPLVFVLVLLAVTSASAAPLVGRGFAVVSTQEVHHECSGAGGEHYVFAIDGDARLAHAGGHAQYLDLKKNGWYVAELQMTAPVSADRDGNPDSSVSGWCLDRLPKFGGQVLRLIPAADRDAAVTLLATIAVTGLPRATLTLKAATRESFALARVTGHAEITDGRRYQLQAIDGDVPAQLDVPARTPIDLWTGDAVVVATAGSGDKRRITRVLAADDLAGGRRWLETVRAHPWPPSWTVPGYAGAYTGTRWAALGKVVKGKRGCGPELDVTTWMTTGLMYTLTPARVAAPPGVARGEVVSAVIVPNPDGKDRCGRTAHVVRAYATPAAKYGTWMIGGEAAPSAALVE